MYCNRCGHSNPDGALFCSACGVGLKGGPAGAVAPTTVHVPSSGSAASTAAAFDEEAWRAFIGPKNTDYYVDRFRNLAAGRSGGWHWPAFLVTWYWLLYRRMFGYAIGYMVLPYVLFVLAVVSLAAAGTSDPASHWLLVVAIAGVFWVMPALLGNRLYFRHGRKQIEKLSGTLGSREALLGALAARGGSGGIVTFILVLMGIVALVGILAAISLPAYQDYTKRAKVSEAIVYGRKAAEGVLEYWTRTKTVPTGFDELVVLPALPPSVRDASIGGGGSVQVHLKDGSGSVTLTPHDDGTITCTSQLTRKQWAPSTCR